MQEEIPIRVESISAKPRLSGISSGSLVIFQTDVTSLGRSRFVTPISFKYASAENERMVGY
jgi:hypothetical protein